MNIFGGVIYDDVCVVIVTVYIVLVKRLEQKEHQVHACVHPTGYAVI